MKNFELSTDQLLARLARVILENEFLRAEGESLEAQLLALQASVNGLKKAQKPSKQST